MTLYTAAAYLAIACSAYQYGQLVYVANLCMESAKDCLGSEVTIATIAARSP